MNDFPDLPNGPILPEASSPWMMWGLGIGILIVLLGIALWRLARRKGPPAVPAPVDPWDRAFKAVAGLADDLPLDRQAAATAVALRRLMAALGRSPWPAFTARELPQPMPSEAQPDSLPALLAACERLASEPEPNPVDWQACRDHCLRRLKERTSTSRAA